METKNFSDYDPDCKARVVDWPKLNKLAHGNIGSILYSGNYFADNTNDVYALFHDTFWNVYCVKID